MRKAASMSFWAAMCLALRRPLAGVPTRAGAEVGETAAQEEGEAMDAEGDKVENDSEVAESEKHGEDLDESARSASASSFTSSGVRTTAPMILRLDRFGCRSACFLSSDGVGGCASRKSSSVVALSDLSRRCTVIFCFGAASSEVAGFFGNCATSLWRCSVGPCCWGFTSMLATDFPGCMSSASTDFKSGVDLAGALAGRCTAGSARAMATFSFDCIAEATFCVDACGCSGAGAFVVGAEACAGAAGVSVADCACCSRPWAARRMIELPDGRNQVLTEGLHWKGTCGWGDSGPLVAAAWASLASAPIASFSWLAAGAGSGCAGSTSALTGACRSRASAARRASGLPTGRNQEPTEGLWQKGVCRSSAPGPSLAADWASLASAPIACTSSEMCFSCTARCTSKLPGSWSHVPTEGRRAKGTKGTSVTLVLPLPSAMLFSSFSSSRATWPSRPAVTALRAKA
mmetsp:Transcript_28110/g.81057  ORF Transcript_28110/g.81057 Transcript_28110/m.81057 type:complete len:460 (-) Transcript_28110:689-2068(-)